MIMIGEVSQYKGRPQIQTEDYRNISIDSKCETYYEIGDTVEFEIKTIVPRNGNNPFDVAIVKKVLYGILEVYSFSSSCYFRVHKNMECLAPDQGEERGVSMRLPITEANVNWAKQFYNFEKYETKLTKVLDATKKLLIAKQIFEEIGGQEKRQFVESLKKMSISELKPFVNTMGLSKYEFDQFLNELGLKFQHWFEFPYESSDRFVNNPDLYIQYKDLTFDMLKNLFATYKFFNDFNNFHIVKNVSNSYKQISSDVLKIYTEWGLHLTEELTVTKTFLTLQGDDIYEIKLGSSIWKYETDETFPKSGIQSIPNMEGSGILIQTNDDIYISSKELISNIWKKRIGGYVFYPAVEFPFTEDVDIKESNTAEYWKKANIKTVCYNDKGNQVFNIKKSEIEGFSNFFELKKAVEKYFTVLVDSFIDSNIEFHIWEKYERNYKEINHYKTSDVLEPKNSNKHLILKISDENVNILKSV